MKNDITWIILGWLAWNKLSGQIAPGVLNLHSPKEFSGSTCASPWVKDAKKQDLAKGTKRTKTLKLQK